MTAASRLSALPAELALDAALRAGADGSVCAMAAVELVIEHGTWLSRHDFVVGFTETVHGFDNVPMAFVDWAPAIDALSAGQLACSSSEEQLLRVAASLAEGIPINLSDAACSFDQTNAARVARALLSAAGHPEAIFHMCRTEGGAIT